jgi:hypothetical protein
LVTEVAKVRVDKDAEKAAAAELVLAQKKKEREEILKHEEEANFRAATASLSLYDFSSINEVIVPSEKSGYPWWWISLSVFMCLCIGMDEWFVLAITLSLEILRIVFVVLAFSLLSGISMYLRNGKTNRFQWVIYGVLSSMASYRPLRWFVTRTITVEEKAWSAEEEFADWKNGFDLRPTSMTHVKLSAPEARAKVQWRSRTVNHLNIEVPVLGNFNLSSSVELLDHRTLRPSLTLLAECSTADICGMTTDPIVARDRISNQLRVSKHVNVNKFTAQIDGVYQDTAILAYGLWRMRAQRVVGLPYF